MGFIAELVVDIAGTLAIAEDEVFGELHPFLEKPFAGG